jgi:hypothetical protein
LGEDQIGGQRQENNEDTDKLGCAAQGVPLRRP